MEVDAVIEGSVPTNNEIIVDNHIVKWVISSMTNATSNNEQKPCTETNSHANMCVVGKNCFIFEHTGKTCNVSAFSPTIEKSSFPIVDAVIVYDCPYTLKSYLMMIRNALYVEELENNLIPPFLLREAGIQINECPKIHSECPTVEDHSIYFKDEDLRIPLKLKGIFSYFNHRIPTYEEIDVLNVIFLTPDSSSWDPHSNHYANEEEAFLDNDGLIVDNPRKRKNRIVDD